jgi:hypothetical protein
MSRLRAYAFAWAFSEQFEIGLLSEASVGQIQRYCCQYGFVDHVITPNAGLGVMVGLDAVDKYVTRRIEDRTKNVAVRMIARVALNPPQSFANLMAFQVPWRRENRSGVRVYDGEPYLAVSPKQASRNLSDLPEVPRFELTANVPSFLKLGGLSCIGGGGIGAFRLTDVWQWTLQVDGCTLLGLRQNWHGDSLTFATGPQWTANASGRWSPRVHMRVGGHKVTEQQSDAAPGDGTASSVQRDTGSNSLPWQADVKYETTGFSMSIGGGMDIRLNRALNLQLANMEYVHSWLGNLHGINLDNGFRVSTGLVLRIGTW